MSSLAQPHTTPEQYLALERKADRKSEYVNGQILSITRFGGYPGASREHNLISVNVVAELRAQLRGRPCEAYTGDMRVKVSETGMYTYPDAVVVCGDPQFEDAHVDTLINPAVIVEVLSPSTEAYDRGAKAAHYRRLPLLSDYVLIAQDRVSVEHFVRQGEQWLLSEADDLSETLHLASIDCRMALSDLYDRVEFAAD